MGDLFDTLARMGIEPQRKDEAMMPRGRYTEHRTAGEPEAAPTLAAPGESDRESQIKSHDGIAVGDKVVLAFGDDQRRISLRLTDTTHDLEKGLLSNASALGKVVAGAEEGDEIEFEQDGRRHKALIETVDRESVLAGITMPTQKDDPATTPD